MVVGALTVIHLAVVAGFMIYAFCGKPLPKTDYATNKDVRFVLNWCNLGEQRIGRVVHSYNSVAGITADHLTAFAIEVKALDVAELESSKKGNWHRGDRLPPNLQEAVKLVAGCRHEIPWFIDTEELNSDQVYIYPWSLEFGAQYLNAATLIIARPRDKMIFFFDEAH